MPRFHGVRIAETKRSRRQYQEQRTSRICLSRVTSFGGARALRLYLEPDDALRGNYADSIRASQVSSNAPRSRKTKRKKSTVAKRDRGATPLQTLRGRFRCNLFSRCRFHSYDDHALLGFGTVSRIHLLS